MFFMLKGMCVDADHSFRGGPKLAPPLQLPHCPFFFFCILERTEHEPSSGGGRDKRAEGKKIKILFLLVILAELSLNTITFYFDRFVLIRFGADDDSADGLLAADVVVVDVVFDHHHRDFFFLFFCFVSIQFGEEKKISTRAEN